MSSSETFPKDHPRPREITDADPGIIVRLGMIFVAAIAVCLVGLAFLFMYFERIYPDRTSEAAPRVAASDLPPGPRLQTIPALDLQTVRASEDRHLSRYAWVNQQQGAAQIPIERAMQLVVQRGLPAAASQASAVQGKLTGDKQYVATAPLTSGFARTAYELDQMESREQKMSAGETPTTEAKK